MGASRFSLPSSQMFFERKEMCGRPNSWGVPLFIAFEPNIFERKEIGVRPY